MESTINTREAEYANRFVTEITTRSNKLIEAFLIGHFVFGLIIAFYYDTWFIATTVGGTLLALYYLSKKMFPTGSVNQYVASAALGVFMGQFIYQMHGMFEMHFFAFIGAALLITYQNWKVQIPLAIVIVLHHSIFGYMQYYSFINNLDSKIYFTQLNYMDLQTFVIHALLAVIIQSICCLWAFDLKKRTFENTRNIVAMEEMTHGFSKNLEFAAALASGDHNPATAVDENDPMGAVLKELQSKLAK